MTFYFEIVATQSFAFKLVGAIVRTHYSNFRVQDTCQLRWWLLGFGDQVEVLEPEHLRAEFAEIARSLHDMYS